MAKSKKKSSNTIKANFKGVKAFKVPTDGNYRLRVTEAELTTSSNDNEMINITCEVVGGEFDGSKVWDRLVFSDGSLYRVRTALEAMGLEVPEGNMEIHLLELIDLEFGAELTQDKFEGKKKAVITEYFSAEEVDSEESEEEDKPKTKSKKSKKEEPEEEEEVDVDSLDEDELQELVNDKGLDVDLDDYSSIKKKRAAVAEALEGGDSEDEEEVEETTYTEDQINEMSQEELEALNEDLELDIEDLDDMSKKTARRNVIKALKKKKLLEE